MSCRGYILVQLHYTYGDRLEKARNQRVFYIRSLKKEIWGVDVLYNLMLKPTNKSVSPNFDMPTSQFISLLNVLAINARRRQQEVANG